MFIAFQVFRLLTKIVPLGSKSNMIFWLKRNCAGKSKIQKPIYGIKDPQTQLGFSQTESVLVYLLPVLFFHALLKSAFSSKIYWQLIAYYPELPKVLERTVL